MTKFDKSTANDLICEIADYLIRTDSTCPSCYYVRNCKADHEPFTESCVRFDDYLEAERKAEEFVYYMRRLLG